MGHAYYSPEVGPQAREFWLRDPPIPSRSRGSLFTLSGKLFIPREFSTLAAAGVGSLALEHKLSGSYGDSLRKMRSSYCCLCLFSGLRWPSMKILIADDEPVSRRMLEWLVRKNGDEPVVLANGSLAGWLLQRDDAPRVAILDWLMPGLDGIQICRLLRSRTDRPYTYILLVTSKTQKEDLVRGLEAGADDYITKPFDPDELNLRINVGRRVAEVQDRLLSQIHVLRRRLAMAEPAGRFAARAARLNPPV